MSKNLSLHLSNENALRYISASDGKALLGTTPKNHISNSFKSPLKPSFVLNKSPYGSPTNIYHKGSFGVNNLKSPSEKNHPALISMEQPEGQENYYYENKGLTTTATKRSDSKNGGSTPQTAVKTQKSASISQKAGSALSKASKSNKVSFYKYEPTIKKIGERSHEPTVSSQMHMNSTITGKETAKQLNLTTKKEMSLSKKASLPTNLKLTLDKIYTKDGSSSHRIHLNSPKSESSNNVNGGGNSSVHRKNGKSVALDNKSKNELVAAAVKEPHVKNKLNTLLAGLSRPSPNEEVEQENPSKVPKLNVRDINSMNVTPRKYDEVEPAEEVEEEEIFEEDEDDGTTSSKRYRKLLILLKEKNNEIRRLSKDKSELKNTLDVVGEELTSLHKMKSWLKDKGKSASNLQLDFNDIVLETEEQTNQLTKKGRLSQDFSRNLMQSRYTSQRSMCNLSIGDTKEARTPTSCVLNTSHSNMDGASDRLRMALAGEFGKKSTNSKKPAGPVQTSTDFLQIPVERSYLSMSPYESNRPIFEYGLKERTNSLVHNETAVKNGIKAKLEGKEAHPHYSKERAKSMQQNTTPKNGLSTAATAVNSRKQSAYGITQKTQLENAKRSGSNASSNDITVDVGILKRKQSHDVNYNLEKTQNLLKRKHSEVKNMSVAEVRKQEDKIDIGKALGDLKNRIANLLNKRSEDSDRKLQLVCQTIQRTLLNGDFQ